MFGRVFGGISVGVRVRFSNVCTGIGYVGILTRFGSIGTALVDSVESVEFTDNTGDGTLICLKSIDPVSNMEENLNEPLENPNDIKRTTNKREKTSWVWRAFNK
ncbi:hypothetical protein C1645_839722 [Glomus cerebriforme]|uniref:Uncharacterized protein n=1 Tax=Glomus cerebriforme TaxID=658196 RepID=A0A397S578_9GLOM|nr:hypothetical protein C1645_839722 [Glomus cerebriforme]